MSNALNFFLVCVAGGLGTGARYLVGMGMASLWGDGFPLGTLAVNVCGSFLLALLASAGSGAFGLDENTRTILTVGFMGGFTTYSSFNQETLRFFQGGAWAQGAFYLVVTVVLCLAAGLAGSWLGARLVATAGA